MTVISSKDNPSFKAALRVAQGKKIGTPPLVWLEGVHLTQAGLAYQLDVQQVFFDATRLETDHELQQLAQQIDTTKQRYFSPALMQQLSQVEAGQGVGTLVCVPPAVLPEHITTNSVYLDRIQDPGNLGTLLRTIAAAGLNDVYLSPGCCWAWSQKVLRSAQGAHFALRIYEAVSYETLFEKLSIPLCITALEQAESLYQQPLAPQLMWAFGNEGQGVSAALVERAQQRVFIPQDPAVESLNVAIAAAVCLFEQRRQLLVNT